MAKLGVNIDHVATVRQARMISYPDPVAAAVLAELAGADSIVAHLREDRRHVQDRDLEVLRQTVSTRLNMEMSIASEIVEIACRLKPHQVTLVPEKREELTTEGGLDVTGQLGPVTDAANRLADAGIEVSLFIDPDEAQIGASAEIEAVKYIELHTGTYAEMEKEEDQKRELQLLYGATELALSSGLRVVAGHGLHYHNTIPVAAIPGIEELNIGHSIIARAVLVGIERAVAEMKDLCMTE